MTVLQTIAVAFAMFSALPVPQFDWNEKNMRYAMCAFPLIGMVCGGLWCLCGVLPLPELARAAAFCLVPVAVTGGIPLDGYADTSDALSSYGDREKKLEILKDSHCGAFAVIRLCCYFVAYFGLCGSVQFTPRAGLCWTLALVLERALSGFAVAAFPLAKDTGLAHTFATAADKQTVCRFLCGLSALLILALTALGGGGLAAAALLALLLWAVNTGSLHVTPAQLLRGLFVEYDPNVATVYDLRFPRIFIALFGGAATAVAGVLLLICALAALPSAIYWLPEALTEGGSYWTWLVEDSMPMLMSLTGGIGCLFGANHIRTTRRMCKKINNIVGDAKYMYIQDIADAIREKTGYDITGQSEEQLREACKRLEVEIDDTMGKGKLIDAIFGQYCEEELIQPTFIMDYPCEMSPLCKRHRSNPDLTERFELFVNGKELCNAYSELNDPIDQLERFQEQLRLSEKGDDEAMFIDMDFVRALEYGMPTCSGMGIGIDRLTMFMTGNSSIQDVLFFPQMRPEKKAVNDPAEKYTALGIPEEWVPVIQKMGYLTADSLKKLSPGKFFNDLCGFNKKNKLGLKAPSMEEVKKWCEQE